MAEAHDTIKILLVGNCQISAIAACMKAMNPGLRVRTLRQSAGEISREGDDFDLPADLLYFQAQVKDLLDSSNDIAADRRIQVPRIVFRGYHPDMVYVRNGDRFLPSPTGCYHSAIALFCYLNGLSVSQTMDRFNDGSFSVLGYYRQWDESVRQLILEAESCGIGEQDINGWRGRAPFMHTLNHPKLIPLSHVASHLLSREGIPLITRQVDGLIRDEMQSLASWGVYPEIADRIGVAGGYIFKRPDRKIPEGNGILGLEQFIEESFALYREVDATRLSCDQLNQACYRQLLTQSTGHRTTTPAHTSSRAGKQPARDHPYSHLPDHQFWRRAVSDIDPHAVDPFIEAPWRIEAHTRIATAGSCFAQHLSRNLHARGFNHLQTETPPLGMKPEEAHRRGYGVYSARYGNIYTAGQLLQLIERAYADFHPRDDTWRVADGSYVDPFRPRIEPAGYASRDELEAARETHLAAVRTMFEHLDVFIFTLGLTETWRSKVDGAIFPLVPGAVAPGLNTTDYVFHNTSLAEAVTSLQSFVDRLKTVNEKARVIFTVSPVPLIATYEKRHVIVATTYSKSLLRVAADEICRLNPQCCYFPSYEIINGHYNRGAYYEDDLREIRAEGVAHVMKVFFAGFAGDQSLAATAADGEKGLGPEFEIVCEEEEYEAW